MRRLATALALAAALPAAALASTITIDSTTPGAVWDGIVEGFPGLPGRIGGNPLSVVRRGDALQLRSVMEFPLSALAGVPPDAIVSATLTFNIDDVLSTLGPGTELNSQGADTILVHFYPGDGQAVLGDFGRIDEPPTSVDTGPGTITDATLAASGPVVLQIDARTRLLQALSAGTAFLGVLWRTNDTPTGTSLDDGRGGSASGEPSNTVPGSRMPFLTIEVSDTTPSNCGDGTVDAGEQCDDGNRNDGDCCNRLCAFETAGATCTDENACTTGDACNGAGACVGGSPRSCDDGNECTRDACELATGCIHAIANEGASCDDRNPCTTSEVCMAGQCLGVGVDGTCDDGNPCTGNDTCTAGICQGTPADGQACDDGNPCTDDVCAAGACEGTPADGRACDDGDGCTGEDTCSAGGCIGAPVCGNGTLDASCGEECDDGNAVGADGCSSACRSDVLVGGSAPTECLVQVAFGSPLRDGSGGITAEQACTDGDPTCDTDPAAGVCGFVVAGCFGLADPRLPGCGPATNVKASIVQPKGGGPARANRRHLVAALRTLSMPGCMQPVTVEVAVRRRGKKVKPEKTALVLSAKAAGLGRDRDTVRLVCRPAS
jgi:cysteine-rich repeat protein